MTTDVDVRAALGRAAHLLQRTEAELRGAVDERRAYTQSLDAIHTRLSRMDQRLEKIEAGTRLPNGHGAELVATARGARGSSPHLDDEDETYDPELTPGDGIHFPGERAKVYQGLLVRQAELEKTVKELEDGKKAADNRAVGAREKQAEIVAESDRRIRHLTFLCVVLSLLAALVGGVATYVASHPASSSQPQKASP